MGWRTWSYSLWRAKGSRLNNRNTQAEGSQYADRINLDSGHFFCTRLQKMHIIHDTHLLYNNTHPIAIASLLFLSVMKLLATAFTTGSSTWEEVEKDGFHERMNAIISLRKKIQNEYKNFIYTSLSPAWDSGSLANMFGFRPQHKLKC